MARSDPDVEIRDYPEEGYSLPGRYEPFGVGRQSHSIRLKKR
jgi:hypothetical protein